MHETAKKIVVGDVRTASRLIRAIDDGDATIWPILKDLQAHTGNAYVIGITGSPGVGKSTMVDQLITHLRGEGKSVGVLTIDPSSPFTGGAILGDRIRMQRHATDDKVFIRSMATRGALGGLSHATRNAIKVLDAMGKDTILIETVGVGQDEVDVVGCADTTIVVLPPGMGDDIQAIKAGILEIADIFVINKADLDGADKAVSQLAAMLDLDGHKYVGEVWKPPILKVEAVRNIGVADLMQAIDRHAQCASPLDAVGVRARDRDDAKNELLELVQTSVAGHCAEFLGNSALVDQSIDDIVSRKSDPYTESEKLVRHILAAMPRD